MPVSLPSLPPVPPLWKETRLPLEWARLRRSGVFRDPGLPEGAGRAVVLVPGFLAGDSTLSTLAGWLQAAGWRAERAGIRVNVACSGAACDRLEERIETLAGETGERVAVIGHSRGGV